MAWHAPAPGSRRCRWPPPAAAAAAVGCCCWLLLRLLLMAAPAAAALPQAWQHGLASTSHWLS